MRSTLALALGLSFWASAALAASAVESPSGDPAPADAAEMKHEIEMGGMGHHADRLYTFTLIEADHSRSDGEGVVNWDAEGWLGGDRDKLWWKSEGEVEGGTAKQAEVQALYSRNVWTFFDAQIGVRHDFEPVSRTYLAVGLQGLAPYLLETELTGFVSDKGDVSARLKQSFDLRMTNRLVLEPAVELDLYLYLHDVPEAGWGSGLAKVETGLSARYEINRKFAPYVSAVYERRLGDTARLARARGEDAGGWSLRSGLRVWF